MSSVRVVLFVGLAAALVGCSSSGPSSKVSGTVRYKGEPLKAGVIYFMYDQGQYYAPIRPDGTYEFADLPTGAVKVVVDTETFNPENKIPAYGNKGKMISKGVSKQYGQYDAVVGGGAMAKGGGGDAKGGEATVGQARKEELAKVYVKIPKKYSDVKTTDLTYTVESGSRTKDFDLTD